MSDLKVLFGKRVKKFRLLKKLSQEELAEKMNIAVNNVGKIERGESFVTSVTLEKLINILDVKAKDLFEFDMYLPVSEMKTELNEYLQKDENVEILYRIYKSFIYS